MYKLGEERIFCLAEGQEIVFKKGKIVGRTIEQERHYNFQVGDKIFTHIPEKDIK